MAYQPNKAIHPGHVIARALERERMTQKNLCERTGLSEKHVSQIINGEASITVETALLFENALGGAASFWINLEKNYQETTARIDRASSLIAESPLLAQFPYLELAKRGYVEQTSNKQRKVENLWKFFGVNSLSFVQTTEAIAYRRRDSKELKSGAIAAWLRCGELESKKENLPPFSESKLKQSISKLRELTLKKPEEFYKEVKTILAVAGVSIVFVPHMPGTGVSAAVRWVGDCPVIQIGLLGKYADIFWFNLFHEIGHLVLHGKKEKFIEFESPDSSMSQEKEVEANTFASNALIPREAYEKFLQQRIFCEDTIVRFAESIGVHPGIVEGRLCHDKITGELTWSRPLGFRMPLRFTI